jgi:hypothetical protein
VKSGSLLRRVCLFVRPSVCPRGTTPHLLGRFSRNLTKIVEKIQVSLKSDENKRVLCLKTYVHLGKYLGELFLK